MSDSASNSSSAILEGVATSLGLWRRAVDNYRDAVVDSLLVPSPASPAQAFAVSIVAMSQNGQPLSGFLGNVVGVMGVLPGTEGLGTRRSAPPFGRTRQSAVGAAAQDAVRGLANAAWAVETNCTLLLRSSQAHMVGREAAMGEDIGRLVVALEGVGEVADDVARILGVTDDAVTSDFSRSVAGLSDSLQAAGAGLRPAKNSDKGDLPPL